jgi:hypothetical protein
MIIESFKIILIYAKFYEFNNKIYLDISINLY